MSLEAKSNLERRLEAARVLLMPHGHKLARMATPQLECVENSTEPGHCSRHQLICQVHFCLLQVTILLTLLVPCFLHG